MRKTYAYNSITIGVLVGILVALSTENTVLGVLAGLGVAVVGFIVIRLIENAVSAGVDKVVDTAAAAHQRRKEQKAMQNGAYMQPNVTQMPQRMTVPQRTAVPQRATFPQQTPPAQAPAAICPYCGERIRAAACFCPSCGSAMQR